MSTFPEPAPHNPEESGEPGPSPASDFLDPENALAPPGAWTAEPEEPSPSAAIATNLVAPPPPTSEEILREPLFISAAQPRRPSEERIPHMGHLGLLIVFIVFGWLAAGLLLLLALQIHLWGITSLSVAATDYRYNLSSQAAQYFLTFLVCFAVFPLVWHKPFFDGIHWNGSFALNRSGRLVSAAVFCFFVAIINGVLMPGPTNAPVDQLFRAPGAAWVLFAFGVTVAPFFEEMAFRGFLLPALCTAWDWAAEQFTGAPRRPLYSDGDPQWSRSAMIIASIVTSIPFAMMHGVQTAWSLGPFLLLIFVSLVLCWVRLTMRSLAASTLVHACYNLMLFSLMLLGTGGFRHLDKM